MSINETKQQILNTCNELLKKKSFDELTVQEIAKNSGLSRHTFYNHFEDKYYLIIWAYEQDVLECLRKITPEYTWRMAMQHSFRNIKNSNVPYSKLVKNNLVRTKAFDATKIVYEQILKQNNVLLDDTLKFQIEFFCRSAVEMIGVWVSSGYRKNEMSLYKNLCTCLPNDLKDTLMNNHLY